VFGILTELSGILSFLVFCPM